MLLLNYFMIAILFISRIDTTNIYYVRKDSTRLCSNGETCKQRYKNYLKCTCPNLFRCGGLGRLSDAYCIRSRSYAEFVHGNYFH